MEIRYELDNYGDGSSQTLYLRTLKEVKEKAMGEFSLCKDLLTGEVFEPCEIQ